MPPDPTLAQPAAPASLHADPHGAGPAVGAALDTITRTLALVGGALMLVTIGITVVSVIGRYGFNKPLPGDYELVEIVCAIAIFLFFPYTHAQNGNISALFFTSALPPRWQQALDLANDVAFTLIAILLTWRLAYGLADKFSTHETTMLIRVPIWWAFSFAVLSMALLSVVCVARVITAAGALRR